MKKYFLISILLILNFGCPKKKTDDLILATYPQYLLGQVTGLGNAGAPRAGVAVASNADGSTFLYSGDQDSSGVGATFFALRTTDSLSSKNGKMIGGLSCAISADGNTAVAGGTDGARVYIRSGLAWALQGSLIYGTGESGSSGQGKSVSMSDDGNTIAVGGWLDNSQIGAVWIFTRSGSVWSQQGLKLVGTGVVGSIARQGRAVKLSGDGNTLAFGGPEDNSQIGAVWIFTRFGSTWSQQGSKLVGTENTGTSYQGVSLALSTDGNILAVGGSADNSAAGAVWIFNRTSSVWSQQGSKIIASGAIGNSNFGFSVSLSGDGGTLLVGAPLDDSAKGAAYIFQPLNGSWTQQVKYEKPSGAAQPAGMGSAVALSSQGTHAIVGAFTDNFNYGAGWIYYK